jgi:ribokinase
MAKAKPRVCIVGSSNIDLTFRTSRMPKPDETLAGESFQLGFGGKGANQAVMAARLGAQATIITKVGRDAFGERTIHNYREHGVNTAYVLSNEHHTTGVAGIMVDDEARNCIIVVPGANQTLSAEDVRKATAALQAADVLVCQLEVPVDAVLEAFRLARAAGVKTILNPAPARSLPDELFRLTDYCIPNEPEIEHLTGRAVTSPQEAAAAARMLLKRGPHTVIVTLGEWGALLLEGQRAVHIPVPQVKAVDTTGAGDAFIGSLAVYLAEGLPLEQGVRRANTVAALSTTRPGTQSSFPTRVEADAFWATVVPPPQ